MSNYHYKSQPPWYRTINRALFLSLWIKGFFYWKYDHPLHLNKAIEVFRGFVYTITQVNDVSTQGTVKVYKRTRLLPLITTPLWALFKSLKLTRGVEGIIIRRMSSWSSSAFGIVTSKQDPWRQVSKALFDVPFTSTLLTFTWFSDRPNLCNLVCPRREAMNKHEVDRQAHGHPPNHKSTRQKQGLSADNQWFISLTSLSIQLIRSTRRIRAKWHAFVFGQGLIVTLSLFLFLTRHLGLDTECFMYILDRRRMERVVLGWPCRLLAVPSCNTKPSVPASIRPARAWMGLGGDENKAEMLTGGWCFQVGRRHCTGAS